MNILTHFAFKKNSFALGFFISLIGTLPLGYLNVIGLQILLEKGNWATASFIFGIVAVEFFVLKIAAFGAKWLVEQKNLLLFIDIFTIVFFSSIAFYFYFNIGNEKNFGLSKLQLIQFPFVLGLALNSLNFMQWPYWSGIYLYLFRTEKIKPRTNQNNIFIIGALLGTFVGMMLFAQTGNYFLIDKKAAIGKYINIIFTLLFSGLAFFQLLSLFWKRRKVNLI
jgi:threonine/homoserine/homoserine lactone efflux protein